MGKNTSYKIKPIIIPLCFFLTIACLTITTPIHETAHWILSDLDPTITPIQISLFNNEKIFSENVLSSALGYVIVTEKYPGAFDHRMPGSDLIQEIICIIIQLIITIIFVYEIFLKLIKKYPKIILANP